MMAAATRSPARFGWFLIRRGWARPVPVTVETPPVEGRGCLMPFLSAVAQPVVSALPLHYVAVRALVHA